MIALITLWGMRMLVIVMGHGESWMFVGNLRCGSLVRKLERPIRLRAISVVLVTYNTFSSEKIRILSQTQVLLVSWSFVTRPSQSEFSAGSEAFCIGRILHIVDTT